MPIVQCVCRNAWMDERYGSMNRVANAKDGGGVCCTSCGKDIIKMATVGKGAGKSKKDQKKEAKAKAKEKRR